MNMEATQEAIIGYIKAMRDRPDRTHVLKTFQKPIIFISGEKDPGIPVETIFSQQALSQNSTIHILKNQAHMALVEDVDYTSTLVKDFLRICYQ
jgi:pimeloyl-ACP methyl ester carboxylesterase